MKFTSTLVCSEALIEGDFHGSEHFLGKNKSEIKKWKINNSFE